MDLTISNRVLFLLSDISLRYSGRRPLRDCAIVFEISQKFLTKVFTSSIRSKNLHGLAYLFFYFISEFFELFKDFRFMFHQIYILIDKSSVKIMK